MKQRIAGSSFICYIDIKYDIDIRIHLLPYTKHLKCNEKYKKPIVVFLKVKLRFLLISTHLKILIQGNQWHIQKSLSYYKIIVTFGPLPWWSDCQCRAGLHGLPGKPSSVLAWSISGTGPGTPPHTLQLHSTHPDNWWTHTVRTNLHQVRSTVGLSHTMFSFLLILVIMLLSWLCLTCWFSVWGSYLVSRSRTCCLRLGIVVRASTIVQAACLAAWVAGVKRTCNKYTLS